jgi:hypothetical protein
VVVVSESTVPELDACAALRADLVAQSHGPASSRGAAVGGHASCAVSLDGDARQLAPPAAPTAPTAPAGDEATGAAAWLPLVVGLERAAHLPRRELPAHFRRQQPAWVAAAAAFGETRYAGIGDRLAQWRTPDPRLCLVKELLWALEQPEAAGYTRLALAGLTALSRLVPTDDVRTGYVLAQSARAVRTLGDLQAALERYTLSQRLGEQQGDIRLCMRTSLGIGATNHHLGNYPAASNAFRGILVQERRDARYAAAAHHGLMHNALVAGDWDSALDEAWYLLHADECGVIARADVLNLVAELCRRVGRYDIARRSGEVAVQVSTRPDQRIAALQVLVDTATDTCDVQIGMRYSRLLRASVGGSAGPFEDTRALLALAAWENVCGSHAQAVLDVTRARDIANEFGYHQLQFATDALAQRIATVGETDTRPPVGYEEVSATLSGRSQYIVSQLGTLSEQDLAAAVSG